MNAKQSLLTFVVAVILSNEGRNPLPGSQCDGEILGDRKRIAVRCIAAAVGVAASRAGHLAVDERRGDLGVRDDRASLERRKFPRRAP